jgi:menaquinone-9 beta-reductase
MKAFDAVVIGGGPAGATAALLLARAGKSVAVVEKAAFPRRKVCGEYVSATTWPLLRKLGVADELLAHAGPPVRRVGLFAAETMLDAPMPAPSAGDAWGRAIEREVLDASLLTAARAAGAEVLQPWAAEKLRRRAGDFEIDVVSNASTQALRAATVIAAHGSWEPGSLPTQARKSPAKASDLFGFKAHFTGSRLAAGLMPLVLFPGGYGGMVHTGNGRVSFSCCIRRDALAACRMVHPGMAAGEAVIAHVALHCRGVRESLEAAVLMDTWLAAGPIRPGIRRRAQDGLFLIGNAAGEAHPLVAEGISMAIQSAWLLCDGWDVSAARYSAAWRGQFGARVQASRLFAALTVSPATRRASIALLKQLPALLTCGARWSGKAHSLRTESP